MYLLQNKYSKPKQVIETVNSIGTIRNNTKKYEKFLIHLKNILSLFYYLIKFILHNKYLYVLKFKNCSSLKLKTNIFFSLEK